MLVTSSKYTAFQRELYLNEIFSLWICIEMYNVK